MPLRDEPRGERLFQVTDPNGVVVQRVEWATSVYADTAAESPGMTVVSPGDPPPRPRPERAAAHATTPAEGVASVYRHPGHP